MQATDPRNQKQYHPIATGKSECQSQPSYGVLVRLYTHVSLAALPGGAPELKSVELTADISRNLHGWL